MADVKVDVKLNMPRIMNKVENDTFGMVMAKEWKRLIDPYTPHRDGFLERNILLAPFTITYKMPYSHYVYYGVPYVDPLYKVSGFTNDGGVTWFSRPGVKKVPDTSKHFNYSKDPNQLATDHWDQKASQAGKTEQLGRIVTNYLGRLG